MTPLLLILTYYYLITVSIPAQQGEVFLVNLEQIASQKTNRLALYGDEWQLHHIWDNNNLKALELQMLIKVYTLLKELLTMNALKFENLEIKSSDWMKIERLNRGLNEHARLGWAISPDYAYAQIEKQELK